MLYPGFNVIYSWNGTTLVADTSLGDLGGMSVLAGPFTGNADNWLIIGDSTGGPGIAWNASNPMLNYAYLFNAGVLSTPPVELPKPYFNDKPAYAGYSSFWDPYSKSHTSRLWSTDLNQDGLPDILAGQEIWTPEAAGLQKAVFQLLINRGNMVFTDDTNTLVPEFSQDSYIDYSVRLADVDGSGIESMFLSSNSAYSDGADATKQGQYILVNDGTGHLYAAMHDEFRAMRTQIATFLQSALPSGSYVSPNITPQYIAYRTAANAINLVAVVRYFNPVAPNSQSFAFANLPLQINLSTDFRRDMTITSRNGSKRIRTFAGNDTIYRSLPDPSCSIDGGLGTNAVVFPGNRSDWSIRVAGGKYVVRLASGAGGADTLTRIQKAQFDDQSVNLLEQAPGAPTITSLVAGKGRITANFLTSPSSTGGVSSDYTVACSAPGQITRFTTGSTSPISVTGLTGGVTYACAVTASNGFGSSTASAAVTVTLPPAAIDLTPILMLLLD